MSSQSEKEQLERYLRGGSALSRAYREASGELPGPELDRRILEEARRAAGRERRRWLVPAALAAAVLASLGLATFVFERGELERPAAQAPVPTGQDRVLEGADKPAAMRKKESAETKTRATDAPAPHAPAREEMPAETGSPTTSAPVAGAVGLDPEAWLAHIEALRRQGREAEAEASLKAFRERYPNYPVEREGNAR